MIYVCSDLHGYPIERFKDFLYSTGFSKDDTLYIIGDVIDRGKDGVEYLKWIMATPNVKLLLGNHEKMMLDCEFMFDESYSYNSQCEYKRAVWLSNSAAPTLEALSATRDAQIKYIYEFLKKTPCYKRLSVNGKEFLLVHGGLKNFDANKSLDDYTVDDFVWYRPKTTDRYYSDIYTVFGHTPTVIFDESCLGRAYKTETWIDIDAGVTAGCPPMILRLDDMKEFYIK